MGAGGCCFALLFGFFFFFPSLSLRYFLPYLHRRIEGFTEFEMYWFISLMVGICISLPYDFKTFLKVHESKENILSVMKHVILTIDKEYVTVIG